MDRKQIAGELIGMARSILSKDDLEAELAKFLFENPNPADDVIHAWAEKRKLNVHEVEKTIYRLATKFANVLFGGRASKKGFESKDADPKELKMGIEVEKEHTSDADVAEVIALSHLSELKDYYTRLKKMEGEK
jgi:hypothetical protein